MRIYAMDTSFYHSLGAYDFEVRCEMLAELGYDATYLTLWSEEAWNDVPRLVEVRQRYGLAVSAVYATLDLSAGRDSEANDRILRLIRTVEGCKLVELSIRSAGEGIEKSSSEGDGPVTKWLERALEAANENDVTIALYPHVSFWMERMDDGVRLCRAIKSTRLQMVLPAFHWYAVDGTQMQELVDASMSHIVSVNVCGSRRLDNGSGLPATIEPLDEGELDTFALLGALRRSGFDGPVGIQGYSVGGDVYTKLKRSLAVLRDIDRRLEHHLEWSQLREPRS